MQLGRHMHSGEHRLKETVCGDVDWIYLAQNMIQWWTLVDMVINLWVV